MLHLQRQKVAKDFQLGDNRMAQLIERLLYKHEDMNSTLRIHVNKLSMRADFYNPSAGEAGTGRSLGLSQHLYQTNKQTNKQTYQKKKNQPFVWGFCRHHGKLWNEIQPPKS